MASETTNQEAKKAAKPAAKPTAKPAAAAKPAAKGKLALILVRGTISVKKDIIATLDKFALRQKMACVVVPDTPANRQAAVKCKDYIAFGEITEETYKLLVEERGKKDSFGVLKKVFRLHPPRGGFERKGVKKPFSRGGALGNRGEKMNDLIQKML